MNNINSGILLLDVINILPEEVECYIQAPSLENEKIQEMMTDTEFPYYKLLVINKSNKEEFINQVKFDSSIDYFQDIEIKHNGKLLFKGFDGVEFGVLSNVVSVPEWFYRGYILTKMCIISTEW